MDHKDIRKEIKIDGTPCADGGFHLTTRGLKRFGHRELSCWSPSYLPTGAADFLNELADCAINKGVTYNDGDTGSFGRGWVQDVPYLFVASDDDVLNIVDLCNEEHGAIMQSRRVVWDHIE
jgi:hypothetical protein